MRCRHCWSALLTLLLVAVALPSPAAVASHLPPSIRGASDLPSAPAGKRPAPRGRKRLSRQLVDEALEKTGGNKVKAAKVLGVGRATLYRFLKTLEAD